MLQIHFFSRDVRGFNFQEARKIAASCRVMRSFGEVSKVVFKSPRGHDISGSTSTNVRKKKHHEGQPGIGLQRLHKLNFIHIIPLKQDVFKVRGGRQFYVIFLRELWGLDFLLKQFGPFLYSKIQLLGVVIARNYVCVAGSTSA